MNEDLLQGLPMLIPLRKKKQDIAQKVNQTQEQDVPIDLVLKNVLTNNLDRSNEPTPTNKTKPVNNRHYDFEEDDDSKNIFSKQQINIRKQNIFNPSDEVLQASTRAIMNQMIYKQNRSIIEQKIPDSIQSLNKNIQQLISERNNILENVHFIESQLRNNPNNTNTVLQKQVQIYQRSIEIINIAVLLYKDKIDTKTVIKDLKQNIQKLKQQNMQIKGRVINGMEVIQSYMHYLPCERQKNAIINFEKAKRQLQIQRKMRQDIQNKVKNTIQDFSRLYDQADIARKIIVEKLAKLRITQQQLENGIFQANSSNQDVSQYESSSSRFQGGFVHSRSHQQQVSVNRSKQHLNKNNDSTVKKHRHITPIKELTLQQKINRMRNNQNTFKKMKF